VTHRRACDKEIVIKPQIPPSEKAGMDLAPAAARSTKKRPKVMMLKNMMGSRTVSGSAVFGPDPGNS